MKKAISILLLVCIIFATILSLASCGKEKTQEKSGIDAAAEDLTKDIFPSKIPDGQGNAEIYETTDDYGCKTSLEYNSDHRLVKKIISTPGGNTVSSEYKYDKSGNVLEIALSEGTAKPYIKTIFEYDENGKLIKRATESENEMIYSPCTSYAYDEENRTITVIETQRYYVPQYDEMVVKESETKIVYSYDENWNLVRHDFSPEGTPGSYTEYSYYDSGVIQSVSQFSLKGYPLSKEVYNESGKVSEEYLFSPGNSSSTIKYAYEYSEEGNILEMRQYDGDNKLIRLHKCNNSEENKITEIIEYGENEVITERTVYYGTSSTKTEHFVDGAMTGYDIEEDEHHRFRISVDYTDYTLYFGVMNSETKRAYCNAEGAELWSEISEYDDTNLTKKVTRYENGIRVSVSGYKRPDEIAYEYTLYQKSFYNADGTLKKTETYNPDGTVADIIHHYQIFYFI